MRPMSKRVCPSAWRRLFRSKRTTRLYTPRRGREASHHSLSLAFSLIFACGLGIRNWRRQLWNNNPRRILYSRNMRVDSQAVTLAASHAKSWSCSQLIRSKGRK